LPFVEEVAAAEFAGVAASEQADAAEEEELQLGVAEEEELQLGVADDVEVDGPEVAASEQADAA